MRHLGSAARVISAAGVVSALVLGALAAPAGAASVAPTPIDGTLGSRCVGHYGSTAGDTFKVVWRNSGGALVAMRTVTVDSDGVWSMCVNGHRLSAGDSIKATNPGGSHEVQVPLLTIAVNRAHDYLNGRGPAGEGLRLGCDFSNGFEPCVWSDGVRVGPNGYWSAGVKFDIRAGETYHATWRSDDDDRFIAFAQAPIVNVEIGTAKVTGALAPGKTRTIFLYDAAMTRKGKAVVTGDLEGTTSDGSFSGIFRDSHGNPVTVAPGDTVDATRVSSDATFIVPVITATATASNDRVTGACEQTASSAGYAHVYLYRTGKLRGVAHYAGDGEGGVFSFNFRRLGPFDNEANVKPGDRLVIDCIQTGGDGAQLTIHAS
jgi:hypothetical protein